MNSVSDQREETNFKSKARSSGDRAKGTIKDSKNWLKLAM